jgi:hypothetical protein
MFDTHLAAVGLMPGLSQESLEAEDELAFELTCREMADGWVEPDRDSLPDLDSIPTGPFLAAVVSSVDRSRLNGYDVVRLMRAEAKLENWAAASKLASVAEVAHCPPGNPDSTVERSPEAIEYAASEVAAGLTLTRRAADTLVNEAIWLTSSGQRAMDSMAAGRLSRAKMKVLESTVSHLDNETVDAVLDAVLDESPELTTGQLRYRVSKQVMVEDPDGARSSFQEGLKDRRMVTHSNPDFTGCLHLCSCHPNAVAAASKNVDRLARELKDLGDERSLDLIRADVALDLLQGKTVNGADVVNRGGSVHLHVPLETLAGLANTPGHLAGYAPVIADIARQIALKQIDGEWTWSVTSDDEIIATGTIRYRPRAVQKRRAWAEYPTCVHPGCRQDAEQCDLDHRKPRSEGGRTHNDNLAPLCRHHHMMRHHTPWEYHRLPNGDHKWTSPLGHTYIAKRAPPA